MRGYARACGANEKQRAYETVTTGTAATAGTGVVRELDVGNVE